MARYLAVSFALALVAVGAGRASAAPLVVTCAPTSAPPGPLFEAASTDLFDRGVLPTAEQSTAIVNLLPASPTSNTTLAATFVDDVERGHRAWIKGQFDNAITILAPLVAEALAAPAALQANPALQASLHKALTDLALAQERTGDLDASSAVLEELIRSYPAQPLTRAVHGPAAVDVFTRVRDALAARPTATLTVELPVDDGTTMWLDERPIEPSTAMALAPGPYRLLAKAGDSYRAATIALAPGSAQTVVMTSAVTTITAGRPVTFELAMPACSVLARRVALARGYDALLVLAPDDGGLTATFTALAADKLERSARVTGGDDVAALMAYALDGTPAPGVVPTTTGATSPAGPSDGGAHRRGARFSPWKWIVGGAGVAAAGVGGYLLAIHDSCAGETLPNGDCTRLQDTKVAGLATLGGGGALVLTAVVMFVLDATGGDGDAPTRTALVAPVRGGAIASIAGAF